MNWNNFIYEEIPYILTNLNIKEYLENDQLPIERKIYFLWKFGNDRNIILYCHALLKNNKFNIILDFLLENNYYFEFKKYYKIAKLLNKNYLIKYDSIDDNQKKKILFNKEESEKLEYFLKDGINYTDSRLIRLYDFFINFDYDNFIADYKEYISSEKKLSAYDAKKYFDILRYTEGIRFIFNLNNNILIQFLNGNNELQYDKYLDFIVKLNEESTRNKTIKLNYFSIYIGKLLLKIFHKKINNLNLKPDELKLFIFNVIKLFDKINKYVDEENVINLVNLYLLELSFKYELLDFLLLENKYIKKLTKNIILYFVRFSQYRYELIDFIYKKNNNICNDNLISSDVIIHLLNNVNDKKYFSIIENAYNYLNNTELNDFNQQTETRDDLLINLSNYDLCKKLCKDTFINRIIFTVNFSQHYDVNAIISILKNIFKETNINLNKQIHTISIVDNKRYITTLTLLSTLIYKNDINYYPFIRESILRGAVITDIEKEKINKLDPIKQNEINNIIEMAINTKNNAYIYYANYTKKIEPNSSFLQDFANNELYDANVLKIVFEFVDGNSIIRQWSKVGGGKHIIKLKRW